jgi:hypothetical protein
MMRTNTSLPFTMPTSARPSTRRIAQALGIVLLRCLILLVPIFGALLVALLPIGTAVPAPIWVPLAIAVVLLIAARFWFRWARCLRSSWSIR